jgi:SAM-dependent methyltransferase
MSLSEAWDREAKAWIAWARASGHDSYWRFHREQFLPLLPPPGALTVDIGCGEGRLSRHLTGLGHHVIGIDASPTMIEAARAEDPAGDYRCANAAALPLADASCDLAVAFMSLQDVDDIATAIAEIHRVLVEGAPACIALVHPLNSAGTFLDEDSAASPFVIRGSYLDELTYTEAVSRSGLEMTFHTRHRPLEAYSRALEAAGLSIEAIREPAVPSAGLLSERSKRWQRIPLFLHLRVRKRR